MKEAIVKPDVTVAIIDSEIPKPGPDQVLIKVVVSGSNPKDWKYPAWFGKEANQGDDIAGYVEAVGENVAEFQKGDRVAAFHEMGTAGGSYAEYAISWQHTCFHIPRKTTFEEAATLPLAAMTAAIGLYAELKLPPPWTPTTNSDDKQEKQQQQVLPLVVYGAASAVGAFAIQFAQKSDIHPIIAIAGRGEKFVETLIDRSKGDTIVDYRKGDDAVVQGIRDALKGKKLCYAFDAITEHNSYVNIAQVLERGKDVGHLTVVLPIKEKEEVLQGFDKTTTYVGKVHGDYKDFGFVYFRAMGYGLQQGWLRAHPQEVVEGGLAGIEGALKNLKEGKVSAVKYVFRIADTPGLS